MALKVDVKGNINIRRKIVVNGREYSSVEEMPEDVRRAFERAMAGASGGDLAGVRPRIVFNGREYASVDQMPEDVRRLYDDAMSMVEDNEGAEAVAKRAFERAPAPLGPDGGSRVPLPSAAPIEVGGAPGSTLVRLVMAGIVILMLLGALYYFAVHR
jgi:hypothetical protein